MTWQSTSGINNAKFLQSHLRCGLHWFWSSGQSNQALAMYQILIPLVVLGNDVQTLLLVGNIQHYRLSKIVLTIQRREIQYKHCVCRLKDLCISRQFLSKSSKIFLMYFLRSKLLFWEFMAIWINSRMNSMETFVGDCGSQKIFLWFTLNTFMGLESKLVTIQ
jgi:hypothetical protein